MSFDLKSSQRYAIHMYSHYSYWLAAFWTNINSSPVLASKRRQNAEHSWKTQYLMNTLYILKLVFLLKVYMRAKYLWCPVTEGGLTGVWEDELELVFLNTLTPTFALFLQVNSSVTKLTQQRHIPQPLKLHLSVTISRFDPFLSWGLWHVCRLPVWAGDQQNSDKSLEDHLRYKLIINNIYMTSAIAYHLVYGISPSAFI